MNAEMTSKPGPVMSESVEEVQGIFPSDAAMQDAMAKLTLAGFDRAAFSLPITRPYTAQATPEQGAADPMTDVDMRQARTMGTSMAAGIGAIAAAGATIATGGAAGAVIAVAAAVGAGSGYAASTIGTAVKGGQEADREAAANAGELVLAVHAATPEKQASATQIMQSCGASKVVAIMRTTETAAIDSSKWTG